MFNSGFLAVDTTAKQQARFELAFSHKLQMQSCRVVDVTCFVVFLSTAEDARNMSTCAPLCSQIATVHTTKLALKHLAEPERTRGVLRGTNAWRPRTDVQLLCEVELRLGAEVRAVGDANVLARWSVETS